MKERQPDPAKKWDEHDYEQFLRECDARTDKYGELLDKHGPSDAAHSKIEEEMGWGHQENESSDGPSLESHDPNESHLADDRTPAPNPAREGIDWIRSKSGDLHHPLQHRCREFAITIGKQIRELGLESSSDKDLDNFVSELNSTSRKLAGALNPIARGAGPSDPAFTVAYLKRALDHLHRSQAGLEAVAPMGLLPADIIAAARAELFGIRQEILRLMDGFRGRL